MADTVYTRLAALRPALQAAVLPVAAYVAGGGDVEREVLVDAWGSFYTYQTDATVKGMDSPADFLLISAGGDRTFDSRWTKKGWVLETDKDIVRLGSTRGTDEEWRAKTEELFDEIADGLERYYLDIGDFPDGEDGKALAELFASKEDGWDGPYVSGVASGVLADSWGGRILLRTCRKVDGEDAEGRILLSDGPGEPAAIAERSVITVQRAVPPRISGP